MKAKRLISLVMAALMLAGAMFIFASCGEKVAMSLEIDGKTYTVTTKELDFLFPYIKMNLFYSYGMTSVFNDPSFWSSEIENDDGTKSTAGDIQTQNILNIAKNLVVTKYLYEKYGRPAIDNEALEKYKTQLAQMLSYYGYGKEGYYKRYFGYTTDQELDYYTRGLENDAIMEYLFGENGTMKLTDEDKETYYKDSYIAYQFIMLDMNKDITKDEEGNRVQKTEKDKDGNETKLEEYEYTDLTDEQKEEKQKLVDDIEKALAGGTDFAELVEKYSDSFVSHKYAKAYIVTKDGTLLNSDVQAKVKDFEVGDYTNEGISVSNNNYVYFVKRVELPEKAYADEKYEDVFSAFEDNMKSEKYNDICKEYVDKVVVNEKIVSKYSFIKAFLSDFVDTRNSNTNKNTTTSN